MTIILIVGLLVVVVLLVVAVVASRNAPSESVTWARSHGLELTEVTHPIVSTYLRNSRDLRRTGAVGALFIAAAITAGTGLDLHVPGMVWLFCGYVVGCLWAEVSLAHVPSGAGTRAASLETRTLTDYLSRPMLVAQIVLPIGAALLSLISLASTPTNASLDGTSVELFIVGSPAVMRAGAVNTGIVAVLMMAAVAVAQRALLRRPQPLCSPDELAVDDAMRSSSVHLVGASGLVVVAMAIAQQLGYLSNLTEGALTNVLVVSAVLCVIGAYVMWVRWAHRRWPSVRRAALTTPAPALETMQESHHG